MEKKRLNYADMLKGIAVLMVVIYHLTAPCVFRSVVDHLMSSALIMFFFFSGYFYRPGRRTLGENIKIRAKALLIPFFKYSIFFWCVGTIILIAAKEETFTEALLCLRNFFAGCIWNRSIQDFFGWEYYSLGKRYAFLADFWFLIALMLASLLFFLIADKVLESRQKTLGCVAILFAITGVLRGFAVSLPYNLQLVPFWAAFLLLGAFVGCNKLFELTAALSPKPELILGIVLTAVGVTISMFHEPDDNLFRGSFSGNEVLSMIVVIISSLLLISGSVIICARIEAAGIRIKEAAWLGSHSLLIYLYHVFFGWIICRITGFSTRYEEPVDPATLAKSLLLTAVCLALCILRYVIGDKIAQSRKKD